VREHIRGKGGVADSRILEYWRVVDAVSLHRDREITHIGCHGVNAPWNGNQLRLASHSRAGSAGRENGISHATVAAIEHDIFDHADFFALGGFYFCADDLARLDVT